MTSDPLPMPGIKNLINERNVCLSYILLFNYINWCVYYNYKFAWYGWLNPISRLTPVVKSATTSIYPSPHLKWEWKVVILTSSAKFIPVN